MLWFNKRSRAARIAILMAMCLGLATPVLAGTVYSWKTADGTVSFTDDSKHVPSRYRDQAEAREMDGLDSYERFTPTDQKPDSTYAKRLEERRQALRDSEAPAGVVLSAPGSSPAVIVGGSRYGKGGMVVPLDGVNAEEPMVVEQLRTKPRDSMSTRHVTVIKQGGRVISVRKDELSHRDGTGMVPPVDAFD
jgi:hypothetical protein